MAAKFQTVADAMLETADRCNCHQVIVNNQQQNSIFQQFLSFTKKEGLQELIMIFMIDLLKLWFRTRIKNYVLKEQ